MRITHILIIPSLFFCFLTSFTMCAQKDTQTIRKEKELSANIFIDKLKTKKERLKALNDMGYPLNETFEKLIAIASDKGEDGDIRLAALKKHKYDDAYFGLVTTILSDPSEDENLVAGLIENIGRRTTFRLPTEDWQKLQSTLRNRLDDPNENVRLASYRILASSHDILAIDKLVEGLRNGNDIPIPLEDAIELLEIDGPAKHLVTLRPYLNHENPEVRAMVARSLANDPQSKDEIRKIAQGNDDQIEIRKKALRGLSRDDEQFMEYAIELMLNRNENADIRYAAMENGMRRMNYKDVPNDEQIQFALAVESVSLSRSVRTSEGKDLGAEAKRLLAHLKQNFPIIGRYYKFRK